MQEDNIIGFSYALWGQEKPVNSLVDRGLEVCSLEGSEFMEFPEAYTQEDFSVSKDHIPNQEDIRYGLTWRKCKCPASTAASTCLLEYMRPN